MQVALSALLSSQEAAGLSANFAGMVEGMAAGSLGGVRTSVLAQLDGQAALVDSNNRQLARLDLEGSAAILPQVRAGHESAPHTIPSISGRHPACCPWSLHGSSAAVINPIRFVLAHNHPLPLPQICSVRPLAMTPAYDGPIMVTGRNIGGSADTLYCRNGGEQCREEEMVTAVALIMGKPLSACSWPPLVQQSSMCAS